jgi:hypothetical protein
VISYDAIVLVGACDIDDDDEGIVLGVCKFDV